MTVAIVLPMRTVNPHPQVGEVHPRILIFVGNNHEETAHDALPAKLALVRAVLPPLSNSSGSPPREHGAGKEGWRTGPRTKERRGP